LLDSPNQLAKVAVLSRHFHGLSLDSNTWQNLIEKKMEYQKIL